MAGPVAAKALQRIGLGVVTGAGCSCGQQPHSMPVAVASSAESSVSISGQPFSATTSTRSIGLPSKRAPAALAPSAIPFISSRNSLW